MHFRNSGFFFYTSFFVASFQTFAPTFWSHHLFHLSLLGHLSPFKMPTKEQLAKMAKLVRTGGAGSMRRTKKAVHRTNAADDQKLQTALKKLGVSPIGDIEEVNLILTNGNVIHFAHPKVQVPLPWEKLYSLCFFYWSLCSSQTVLKSAAVL